MKRVIHILLTAFLILGTLSGCQKTPEAPAAIEKEYDAMIQLASADGGDTMPIKNRYAVADTLNADMTGANGRMTIAGQVAVTCPDVSAVPLFYVTPVDFTAEQVGRFADAFFGERRGDLIQNRNGATRSELEAVILSLEQMKPLTTGKDQTVSLHTRIEELRALLASAPEAVETVPFDGTFQTEEIRDSFGKLKGTSLYARAWIDAEDGGYLFVKNSDTLEGDLFLADEDGGSTRPHRSTARMMYYVQNTPSFSRNNAIVIDKTQGIPETVRQYIRLTPAEAGVRADALVHTLGVRDMRCMGMMLVTDGNNNWGYELEYVPVIQDIAYAGISKDTADYDAFNVDISYGHLSVWVDDHGIRSVEWDAPYRIAETVVEDANLLAFPQISAIFGKMMTVKYEPYIQTFGYESIRIDVDTAELAYVLIRGRNTNKCLLTPCWVFLGKKSTDTENNGEDYTFFNQPLLVVNAVDGSIVDTVVGY